jgi:F-type H+-transporting ATPase subunit a
VAEGAPAAIQPLVLPIEPEPTHPEAAPAAHAAPHGEAAAANGGGHGGKSEHWTLFNLIPMEWTYDVAVAVGGVFGIPAEKINRNMYNSHGLLHVMIYFFVLVLITVLSVRIGGQYQKMLASGDAAPQPGVTGMNFFEAVVKTVLGMMEEIIGGHDSKKYLPLIGTAAVVILFSNLLGLIPGFYTASDNLNTTLAMAVTIFVMYHYYGIKAHGAGKYLAHFMGPLEGKIKYIMAPLMVPIELISHFARPLSLSLRLFGNMFGDHKVFAVFMGLVAIPLVYPLPFLALGLLVAIVQTLVFCLLSMVYIGLATAKEH